MFCTDWQYHRQLNIGHLWSCMSFIIITSDHFLSAKLGTTHMALWIWLRRRWPYFGYSVILPQDGDRKQDKSGAKLRLVETKDWFINSISSRGFKSVSRNISLIKAGSKVCKVSFRSCFVSGSDLKTEDDLRPLLTSFHQSLNIQAPVSGDSFLRFYFQGI